MYQTKSFDTDHKDVIHDIAFDYYGKRMATCSSDQVVKIWHQNDVDEWVISSKLKCHSGAVWKVTWAHPEFGQIMAICCFDRSATVYQETVTDSSVGMQTTWIKQYTFMDARSYVTDVKFAPKNMGLILATCSADGIIRLYKAHDIMNLSQWHPFHDINTRLPCCSCISWNPSPSKFCPPMLAVGSEDISQSATGNSSANVNKGRVAVYSYSEAGGKWDQVESLTTVTDPVHDIAFAPNPGRSFHTLAIGSKDLKIVILKPKANSSESNHSSGFELQLAGQFGNHGDCVWRVSWNLTGTVLSASGDNGLVKIYKANYLDSWKCVGTLSSNNAIVHSDGDKSAADGNISATPFSTPSHLSRGATGAAMVESGNSSSQSNTTARYFKMASTANPNQVPWH